MHGFPIKRWGPATARRGRRKYTYSERKTGFHGRDGNEHLRAHAAEIKKRLDDADELDVTASADAVLVWEGFQDSCVETIGHYRVSLQHVEGDRARHGEDSDCRWGSAGVDKGGEHRHHD